MWERIQNEPAIVAAVVQALLGLAVAFGLDLTDEQLASIMALAAAILALLVRRSAYGPATGQALTVRAEAAEAELLDQP